MMDDNNEVDVKHVKFVPIPSGPWTPVKFQNAVKRAVERGDIYRPEDQEGIKAKIKEGFGHEIERDTDVFVVKNPDFDPQTLW